MKDESIVICCLRDSLPIGNIVNAFGTLFNAFVGKVLLTNLFEVAELGTDSIKNKLEPYPLSKFVAEILQVIRREKEF